MVLSPSPSVRITNVTRSQSATTDSRRSADTVDQILARVFDAGQFDELETVWMLSA